jgi:hypothetical protein
MFVGPKSTVLLCCVACAAVSAHAQSVLLGEPVTWQWQASTDDGLSWNSGTMVATSSAERVRVRGMVSFPSASTQRYFSFVAFDPFVEGIQNVGSNDSIMDVDRGQLPYALQRLQVRRFGNRLSIDDEVDTLPPGLGPSWALSLQGPNNGTSPLPDFANPINVFEFQLVLDGSLGDRLVTAAWSRETAFNLSPYAVTNVWGFENQGRQWRHPLTEEQLTIRVVPAPASASILVLAGLLGARRRREKP